MTATAERTWNPKIKEIGDAIVGLTVLQAKELGDYLEEVHGIKGAAGGAVMMAMPGAGAGAAPAPAEVKETFDVILAGIDAAKKIAVIKAVREVTSLGLKEAKDLVEGAPKPLREGVAKKEAEELKKKLEEAGAKIELK